LDNNTMAYPINTKYLEKNYCYSMFETIDLPSLVQVGALPSYNSNQVDAITVQIPIIKEQIKIGKFMSDIDNLITLHQRE